MSDLLDYFEHNTGGLIDKWTHYFEVYERHLSQFRDREIVFVEFGVSQGGSLQMWRKYFGPKARIIGVDIHPECKTLEEPGIEIFIGDQEDRSFLRRLANELPPIDVLFDDGGHFMKQQIRTFEELFPKVKDDGVYLCEDLHTSYWRNYGGGRGRRGSFIEFSKHLVDLLNAWHFPGANERKIDEFSRTAHSMHYYDSMLVIEKRRMIKPERRRIGEHRISDYQPARGLLKFFKR